MEIPNFDAMNSDELREFWAKWHRPTKKAAVEFLGVRKDARSVMMNLAIYAINKSCAVELRLKGNVDGATIYEHCSQLCYDKLPADVRW